MIEMLSFIISALALFLQRRDRKQDKSDLDLKEGLIELHEVLVEWLKALKQTNLKVELWASTGMLPVDKWGLLQTMNFQEALIDDRRTLVKLKPAKKALHVYLPHLEDDLVLVLAVRNTELQEMILHLGRLQQSSGDEELVRYLKRLDAQRTTLAGLTEQLRQVIISMD